MEITPLNSSISNSKPRAAQASHVRLSLNTRRPSPFLHPNLLLLPSSALPSSKLRAKPPPPMATPLQSAVGAPNECLEDSSSIHVGENDLLIIGPGVLGRMVAEKWRQEHPGCEVFGQTMTVDHHEELVEIGINPSVKGSKISRQFPYVIFCAPPSRSADYPGDVRNKWERDAASSWNGEGSFLFTSSTAAYDRSDNGPCDERKHTGLNNFPGTDVTSKLETTENENVKAEGSVRGCQQDRIDTLFEFRRVFMLATGAEWVCHNANDDGEDCTVFNFDRGAHVYWLEKGIVDSRPDHLLNLIHYEDAASLSITILKKKFHGRIFLGCDNHPLSRQELMDLVNKSGRFRKKFSAFTGTAGPLGKKMNNSKTRAEVGWEPKYPSFAQFLGLS
ncbi:hypothetical protein ACLOJK_017998 [Asimina triloba]